MTKSITRRTALKAAPAVALTAAVPAMASGEPASRFPALYAELQAWGQAYDDSPFEDGSDEQRAIWDSYLETQDIILGTPPASVLDYAYKIMTADDGGFIERVGTPAEVLVAEARAMISAAPAVAAAVEPESETMRLFREWKSAELAMKEPGTPDDVWEERYDARNRAGEALANAETRSVADLALKIIAVEYTGDGGISNLDTGAFLVREACEIAGMEHMLCDLGAEGIIRLTT